MPKPPSVGIQLLGWLTGMLFTVTGWISQVLGIVILAAMVFVSAWTIWRWYKDTRLALAATQRERDLLKERIRELEKRETERTKISDVAPPSANPYPVIRDDELHNKLFEKRTVYIAEFARKLLSLDLLDPVDLMFDAPVVSGRAFVGCRIYGPAVLHVTYSPTANNLFGDPSFFKGKAFWRTPKESGHAGAGVILLRGCTFSDCRFTDVGFLPFSDDNATQPRHSGRDKQSGERPTDQ